MSVRMRVRAFVSHGQLYGLLSVILSLLLVGCDQGGSSAARENGLEPDRDVRLVNLELGDVPAVFRAGNVDAALVWEPGFSQLEAVPGARVLGMDTDTEVYRRFGSMTALQRR